MRLDPQAYPLALPHAAAAGDTLYFGRVAVAVLDPSSRAMLEACDGVTTFGELLARVEDPGRAAAMLAPYLIWWDEPVGESKAAGGRVERLILSAAPEDAWLAMGGRILLEAAERSTLLVNCFGMVHGGCRPEAFSTPEELSLAARDELATAARMAGVAAETWAAPDDELRRSHIRGLADDAPALREVLRGLLRALLRRTRPRQVWTSASADARSGASALLWVLLEMLAAGELEAELHLYPEAPSVLGERGVDEFLARFEHSYFSLREYSVEIAGTAHRKAALHEVFRTRVDRLRRDYWEQSAVRNARLAGGGMRAAERFWQVTV